MYVAAGLYLSHKQAPAGDESDYLLIAHSLVTDGDIDLKNNDAQEDWREFQPYPFRPHWAILTGDNRFSNHGPGLSLMIAPGYAAGGRRGAVAMMNVIAALLVLQIYHYLRDWGFGPRTSLAATALFAVTPPVLTYSGLIYPDLPGALAALTAWRLSLTPRRWTVRNSLAVGACLAAMAGLHIRFALLAGLLFVAFVWNRRSWPAAVLATLPPLATAGVLLAVYHLFYGDAFYLLRLSGSLQLNVNMIKGLFGGMFDRQFGLLVIAPAAWLMPAGFVRFNKRLLWPSAMFVAQYALVSSWIDWHGGWCPPGRYQLLALPLIAPLAASALSYGPRRTRVAAFACCAAATVAVAALWSRWPDLVYQRANGVNHLWHTIPALGWLNGLLPSWWGPWPQWLGGTVLLLSGWLAVTVWMTRPAQPASWRTARIISVAAVFVSLAVALPLASHERRERNEAAGQPLATTPPQLLTPARGQRISANDELQFAWQPVPGADHYVLHCNIPNRGGEDMVVLADHFSISREWLKLLPPGEYVWHVTPVKDQTPGCVSETRSFFVAAGP